MEKDRISELNDEELQIEIKKLKKRKIINATLVGFLAGVFFFGVTSLIIKKNFIVGVPMLIPLFFIYKLVNSSKKDKQLEVLLKERNVK